MNLAPLAFDGRRWWAVVYLAGAQGPRVVSLHATRSAAERAVEDWTCHVVRMANLSPGGNWTVDLDAA
jgi:hypothetical protein